MLKLSTQMYYDPIFTEILIHKKRVGGQMGLQQLASFLFSSFGKVSPTISGWPR